MKRYYIIYKGRVQGVGFRWWLAQIARKYDLTGYCRNLYNGDVEVEIQGDKVDEFLEESLKPQHFIDVEDYALKSIDIDTHETTFDVRY